MRLDANLASARNIAVTASGGTVDTQGHNGTLNSAITGAGALTKAGTGALTLTDDNSYAGGTTIAAGTLQLSDGGASGSLVGNIVDKGVLIFNRSGTLSLVGAISGAGTIQLVGPGLSRLTGDSSAFSGTTSVQAGALSVSGILGGMLTVLGGRLQGTGTGGATTVAAGGTIVSGNSIGTLTVNGNFVQAAGSTYQVELDPGTATSDQVRENGTATLAVGVVLSVVNSTGAAYAPGQRYTILTSTGLTGTYGFGEQVLTPFLNLRDGYDARNAYLTVVQTRDVGASTPPPTRPKPAGASTTCRPESDPERRSRLGEHRCRAARLESALRRDPRLRENRPDRGELAAAGRPSTIGCAPLSAASAPPP